MREAVCLAAAEGRGRTPQQRERGRRGVIPYETPGLVEQWHLFTARVWMETCHVLAGQCDPELYLTRGVFVHFQFSEVAGRVGW